MYYLLHFRQQIENMLLSHYGVGVAFATRDCVTTLQALLGKLEGFSFFVGEIGEVEKDTHKVRLSRVISLFVIIVDDHFVTLIFSSRDVLEVVQVKRVGKDVVRVHTLEGLAFSLRYCVQSLFLRIG